MTKERLQQHMDNFNQMCSELGENEVLELRIHTDAFKTDYRLSIAKTDSIISANLTITNNIKIGKDE
jgi:hypothetical protein